MIKSKEDFQKEFDLLISSTDKKVLKCSAEILDAMKKYYYKKNISEDCQQELMKIIKRGVASDIR